jgi:dihydroorotate dehydrogenase electron transfer subunit
LDHSTTGRPHQQWLVRAARFALSEEDRAVRMNRLAGQRPAVEKPRESLFCRRTGDLDLAAELIASLATRDMATVVENVLVARDTYRIRLESTDIARAIRPGQFVMVRPNHATDPLLGRPFALYDVIEDEAGVPWAIDLVYLVVGRGTSALATRRAGDRVLVWGPLGNGFGAPVAGGEAVFVAGGIGQTPFLALGKWWLGRQTYADRSFAGDEVATSARLLYGARDAGLLAGLDDFTLGGLAVEVATDDGSAGTRGYVTDLLAGRLDAGFKPAKVIGCGPAPMLSALSKIALRHDLDCDLSLENTMACGFGACFSCVAPIRQPDGSADLRRVCVEGPIFACKDVVI